MCEINLKESPLDDESPAAQEMFTRLQGNILKSHGRDFGRYILFQFGEDTTQVRELLRDLCGEYVTSAHEQRVQAELRRKDNITNKPFGNLFISASGYRVLGYDLSKFTQDPVPAIRTSFSHGMKKHAVREYRDPDPSQWEAGYRERIDALLFLAHEEGKELSELCAQAEAAIARHCRILAVEHGNVWRNGSDPVEHFGFADGRSQPLFLKSDSEGTGGVQTKWNPFELLERVLVKDPLMPEDSCCYGSYVVFRKLEQDVQGFRIREEQLADALALEGRDRERAGAMVIGRFRDGTPIVVQDHSGMDPAGQNAFLYNEHEQPGQSGWRCPFHAHIRKANPRDTNNNLESHRLYRMTRRSMSYGARKYPPHVPQSIQDMPKSGVGLLFQSFQSLIPSQFAFAQAAWSNSFDFPEGATGLDPITGHQVPGWTTPQNWSAVYDTAPQVRFDFQNFVRMRGGEFFFAPSLPFLLSLATRADV